MYTKKSLLNYILCREIGVSYKYKYVVISRPPGDLPYEDYYNK